MSKPISQTISISKIPADLLQGLSKKQIEYIQDLQNQVQTLQKTQKKPLVIRLRKIKFSDKQKPIRKASIDLVGQQLGFKKKAFREYLEQKKVDLSKFSNELDLYPYMKTVVDKENFTKTIQSEGFNIDPPKFELEHAKNSIQDNLASIGKKLGFDEFDLIEYLKLNHIDVSKFNSPTDLYSFMKSRLEEEKKDKDLIKTLKTKGYQEKPPNVKPLEKENKVKFWMINEILDPSQEDEIKQLIDDERKKYGESNYNKHYKMIFNNNITSYKDTIHTLTDLFKQMPTMFRLLFSFGVVMEKHHHKTDDKGNIIEDYYTYEIFRPGKNYFLQENVIIKNKQDFNHKVLFNCTDKI